MTANLFDNLPSTLLELLCSILLESDDLRIERIVSQGHASPEDFWYDKISLNGS